MAELQPLLNRLPERHRIALTWFVDHVGMDHGWPQPLPDGTFLATKAKGIYKPEWSEHALSVRQSLGGRYPDHDPVYRPDGTWVYRYFQENPNPNQRDDEFTNVALMRCLSDKVPVGVMRQVRPKPNPQYRILGVALVAGWNDGYFTFEGFSPAGASQDPPPAAEMSSLLQANEQQCSQQGVFDPHNIQDARQRTLASIVCRRGQPQFRRDLIEAYHGQCAISGCDAVEALEASHIIPYMGPDTNHPTNGLLLRGDLHTLFDLGLMAVNSETMTVIVSPVLMGTIYGEFNGQEIRLPDAIDRRPSRDALAEHRRYAGL
jgi:putative restriction endonuclease